MKHEKLSEKYKKWIIEYYSPKYKNPRFFVWLTDISDNEIDKIIITENQIIISEKSKRKLLKKILKAQFLIPDKKNTREWLKESLKCKKLSATKIDIQEIPLNIKKNKLNYRNLEKIVNFINLFEDYKFQIGIKKSQFESRKKTLVKLWNYYYEQIFFPRFNKKNQQKYKPQKLKINNRKLLVNFNKMVNDFDKNLK